MAEFVLVYSLTKIVRSMLAGSVLMLAAWVVCQAGGYRTQRLNLGLLCIVPLAGLMSYSRIFFTGSIFRLCSPLYELCTVKIAIAYFGAAGLLLVRFVFMRICLRRQMRRMQQLERPGLLGCLQSPGPKIRVYLSKENRGPFAGGIVHPYIVMPKALEQTLTEDEFLAILYHEALHIRLGHVLALNIYAVLKIIWWVHPFVYLCDHKLRENIEYSSDEGSVMLGTLNAYKYSSVMLKTLQMKGAQNMVREGITAFCGDGFVVLKKRIQRLGMVRKDGDAFQRFVRKKKAAVIVTAAVFAVSLSAVIGTSYPRYTRMDEIAVYDGNLDVMTYDLASEGIYADITDGGFCISQSEFDKLIAKYRPKGGFLVFSYDTIMKVPGAGGLGQAAMVDINDSTDVNLLARREWIDKLQIFMLKYFI